MLFANFVFLLNSIWYWKNFVFNPLNLLPGDNADARYTTSLYEHWFLFFSGHVNLTENYFFYPVENSMSFSDAYFLQGILHSIFRFSGVNIVNAWLFSSILIHLIGSYSAVLISKRLKLNWIASSVLITFWGFNSVIWVQRGHIQNLAYPLIGYVVLHFIKKPQVKNRKYIIERCAALNFLILIGLSSAYPFVFFVLYLTVGFFTIYLLQTSWKLKLISQYVKFRIITFSDLVSRIRNSVNLIPLLSTIPIAYLFIHIYLLSANRVTTRSPAEASYYSPTFSELLETPPSNRVYGKITTPLFQNSFPPTGERYMGFTPVFLMLFIFAAWKAWLKFKSDRSERNLFVWALALTIIIVELLVLRDGRGFNFWYLTGSRIPFFDAIRGMSRVHQTQYMFGGLLIALYLNKRVNLSRIKNSLRFAAGLLLALFFSLGLILQESNTYYGSWTADDMTPISKNIEIPKTCDSFALIPTKPIFETRPWYLYLIDAQIIATNSRIPTITGYSGGTPLRYNIDFSTEEKASKTTLDYIRGLNLSNVCLVELRKYQGKIDWKITNYDR